MFNRESVRENSWVVCRRGGFYSVVQWLLLKKGDGCSLHAVKEIIMFDGLRGLLRLRKRKLKVTFIP